MSESKGRLVDKKKTRQVKVSNSMHHQLKVKAAQGAKTMGQLLEELWEEHRRE